ncbi:MAG: beta-ketoacyl-[acyl-carrier-protein] synthase family protein [Deltaproteobacteria bacterium]|nr:beta-ketoacyl-[acyl-carrier-protein] synthase family protein [Deltaproteobacteria bacterium]
MGIISPLGIGVLETKDAILKNKVGIRPISLFSVAKNKPLPVGEVPVVFEADPIPRTHALARIAAAQAMEGCLEPPDAVVLGITTGGMLTTEDLLRQKETTPAAFQYHSLTSVTEDIARRYHCTGPVVTVSTACSSSAVAITIALEMIRTGMAGRVLAGGADSLCRLTYYGFHSLQLIDPDGAHPLDKNRRGMSVAEGAAMLLLTADRPHHAVAEILGAGLSCDAYHPTAPEPEGKGALSAMQAALDDAGILYSDIDYINLHGTGTRDNDLAEARAINALFLNKMPIVSSIKGASGHPLAAAGAIEAVVSAIALSDQRVPGNVGCREPDPELNLNPVLQPTKTSLTTVLSNSFGFGGNNASLVMGTPRSSGQSAAAAGRAKPMKVLGSACITGAGDTHKTMEMIYAGKPCSGIISLEEISKNLAAAGVRRLKRLPRLVLSLATSAHENSQRADTPSSVFLGTGWGALSETYDFLSRLYETDEQFPSPIDFVGSVHNSPAGQIAMKFQATGPNITTTGGDYSFEQSMMTASLLSGKTDAPFLLIGADESHHKLSCLLDRSVSAGEILSDGGGALYLSPEDKTGGLYINLNHYQMATDIPGVIPSLIQSLGGAERIRERYGVLLAGIPGAFRKQSAAQLSEFLTSTNFQKPVIDYRKLTGEFASASAVAAVLAINFLKQGTIPGWLLKGENLPLHGKGALIIGLGSFITAMEVIWQ